MLARPMAQRGTDISSLVYPGPYPLGLNRTQAQTGLSLSLACAPWLYLALDLKKKGLGQPRKHCTPQARPGAVHRKRPPALAFSGAGGPPQGDCCRLLP